MKILGCDCSSKLIGYVLLEDNEAIFHGVVYASDTKDINTRAENLFVEFEALLLDLIHSAWKPDVVYIEQAIYVQNIKSTLAIDAVINAVRFCCFIHSVPYVVIDNGVWKKDILGNGKATKEEISKFANIKWPDKFTTQDECDAACLAMYGIRRLQ